MLKSLKNNWLEILLHVLFWGFIIYLFSTNSYIRPFCYGHPYKETVSVFIIAAVVYIDILILFKKFNKKGRRFLYWLFTILLVIVSGFAEFFLVRTDIIHCFSTSHQVNIDFYIIPLTVRNAGFMLFFIIIRYYKESVEYSKKLIRMFEIERLYLSSRIAPHYFSNVIFSMQNLLMTADRETFKYQLEKLEHVISYMMVDSVKEQVTLKDEIRFYASYVELEKIRHASYIDYSVQAERVDFMIYLAPLLFENLICNAFKFCPHDGTGYVKTKYEQPDPHTLLFTCENNISPTIINRKGNGKGLPNLKNRLDLMYPNKHTLEFENKDDKFFAKLLIQF